MVHLVPCQMAWALTAAAVGAPQGDMAPGGLLMDNQACYPLTPRSRKALACIKGDRVTLVGPPSTPQCIWLPSKESRQVPCGTGPRGHLMS